LYGITGIDRKAQNYFLYGLLSTAIASAVGFKIDKTRDEISTRKFGF